MHAMSLLELYMGLAGVRFTLEITHTNGVNGQTKRVI